MCPVRAGRWPQALAITAGLGNLVLLAGPVALRARRLQRDKREKSNQIQFLAVKARRG